MKSSAMASLLDRGISHRLKRTKWASPFTPGHDAPLVMEKLGNSLQELQGVTLVCDCQHGGLCEADMLAGMVFDALRPNEPQPLARVVLTSKTSASASVGKDGSRTHHPCTRLEPISRGSHPVFSQALSTRLVRRI